MTFRLRRSTQLVAAAACCIMACGQSRADLRITEVASSSGAPNPPLVDFDWWELTNTGPNAVNLAGYQWEDSSSLGDQAIFPAATIAPGESIIIHENDIIGGTIRVADDFRSAWGLSSSIQVLEEPDFTGPNPFSGLSSGGDVVSLFDPSGNLVDSVAFPASTVGTTFEWGSDGSNLGLSVNGENGAFLSNYGGVGSPGSAVVPEPAMLTLLLIGLAVCGGPSRYRR